MGLGHVEASKQYVVNMDSNSQQKVIAAVEGLPGWSDPSPPAFDFRGMGIQTANVAGWLVNQAIRRSSEAVVADFLAFLRSNSVNVQFVLALAGINLEAEHQLLDDVRLVPFSTLPRSMQTDLVDPFGITNIRPFGTKPTSALVMPGTVSPAYLRTGQRPQGHWVEFDHLQVVQLLLTLVGPRAVAPVAGWIQISDPGMPLTGSASTATYGGYDLNVFNAMKSGSFQPFDQHCAEATAIVTEASAFATVNPKHWPTILISLSRLNQSLGHSDPVDCAIDLGVALEALLLDDSKDQELAYRMRLRGAWLLASDAESRMKALITLRDVYSLRSAAVHRGILSDKKDRSQHMEALWEGMVACQRMIRTIVQHGFPPDWNRLTLGEGYHRRPSG